MKLLAISGSPRIGGNTDLLVDAALTEAEALGIETEKVILSELNIKPCVGHDTCHAFRFCPQNDDMNPLLDKFLAADGVILATPVYWYNMTAQMKTFIDRNYFAYKHEQLYQAKTAGIIIVAEKEAIEDTLFTMDKIVEWCFAPAEGHKFIATGYAHTKGEVEENIDFMEQCREMGRRMAAVLLEQ